MDTFADTIKRDGEDEWIEERLFRVVLSLSNGESIEVASFSEEAGADAQARDIATRLATTSEWPRVRGRYLRPETILAVEVSERRRLAGSKVRAAWGQAQTT